MNELTIVDQFQLEVPKSVGFGNPVGATVFLLNNGVVGVTTDSGNGIAFTPTEIASMMGFFVESLKIGGLEW